MILSPADRQKLFDAFVDKVGPTALPASTTIDDLCRNLVLAIPALLETCEALASELIEEEADSRQLIEQRDSANAALIDAEKRIATLTTQLERSREMEEATRKHCDFLEQGLKNEQARVISLTAQLEADPCP